MGYYTTYSLQVKPSSPDVSPEMLIDLLRRQSEEAEYSLDNNGNSVQSTKWHSHEDELRKFSSNYPKTLFTLRGEGESAGDLWVKYFRGGRMQLWKANQTPDPFDESKLQ